VRSGDKKVVSVFVRFRCAASVVEDVRADEVATLYSSFFISLVHVDC
jgi:hypothetical protein